LTPTYSEVIYETQPSFVVHECAGPGGLREAAVDFARRTGRFEHYRTSRAGGFFVELDLEHASRGSVQSARGAASRQQRFCNATASG
jgi:hypothetical protein